jgi:hypothetical protein
MSPSNFINTVIAPPVGRSNLNTPDMFDKHDAMVHSQILNPSLDTNRSVSSAGTTTVGMNRVNRDHSTEQVSSSLTYHPSDVMVTQYKNYSFLCVHVLFWI